MRSAWAIARLAVPSPGAPEAAMSVRRPTATLISIAAMALSACATTSDGLEFKVQPVSDRAMASFAWRSRDDHSGILTASLPDGRVFSGPYVWITAETPAEDLLPLWEGPAG